MLTIEQQEIVDSDRDVTVVLAGAGAGKTHTVVSRIHKLIDDGVSPREIVALTFTNKAGDELRSRLGDDCQVWAGTLHSYCLRLCEQGRKPFRILTEWQKTILLESCASTLRMLDPTTRKWTSHSTEFWSKTIDKHRAGVEECKSQTGRNLAAMLQSHMVMGDELDYLEILLQARDMIQAGKHPRIKHLFVDEAQDIDAMQWSIIHDLVSRTKAALTVVGDVRQSLYAWRGAVPQTLEDMAFDHGSFALTECYRCPDGVIDQANMLISRNPEGTIKLRANKVGQGVQVKDWSIDLAIRFAMDSLYDPDQIAVLCRSNRLVSTVAEALRMHGHDVYTPTKPYERDPIAAILDFGVRPHSSTAWAVFDLVMRDHLTETELLDFPTGPSLAAAALSIHPSPRCKAIGYALLECDGPRAVVGQVLAKLTESCEFGQVKWWSKLFGGFEIGKALNMRSMLESEDAEQGDRIAVMTVHQAKGLEWPVVIIPQAEQGRFPTASALSSPSGIEDERRVWYVAITRARDMCFALVDQGKKPSQFIGEMDNAKTENRPRIQGTPW